MMTFPVRVQQSNGEFVATVVGTDDLRATGASRDDAVEALQSTVAAMIDRGEIIEMEAGSGGLLALAGKYADDPFLQEIIEEAYRERDRERDELPY
jgi:predicted RNase H-like HicB family nuclease